MSSVYEDCKAAGLKMDSHESDLYIRDTPETREILRAHNTRVRPFTDNIEHKTWLEVPFGYPHGRGGKRHAPNRLPVAPPPRQHPVHTPSLRAAAGGGRAVREGALDHVRRIAREHEKPFDPSKRGTWRGSSRDLVVNPSKKFKQARGGRVDRDGDSDEIEFIIIEEETGRHSPTEWVLVNPLDLPRSQWAREQLFGFQFGAMGTTFLLVWSSSIEKGLEEAAGWCAQYTPGHLISEEEVGKLMEGSREDDPDLDDEAAYEAATADLTYTESGYIAGYEWHVNDVDKGTPLYDAAFEASKEEYVAQYGEDD